RPIEVTAALVPVDLAACQRDQHPIATSALEPPLDLPPHPQRGGSGWRGQEDQVGGAVQRLFDACPELRAGGKARVVPEDPEAGPPVPSPSKPVHPTLQSDGQRSLTGMAVGDEGTVPRRGRLRLGCARGSYSTTPRARHAAIVFGTRVSSWE